MICRGAILPLTLWLWMLREFFMILLEGLAIWKPEPFAQSVHLNQGFGKTRCVCCERFVFQRS